MIPYKWPVQTVVPPTLAKRLEVMEAIRRLAASEDGGRIPQHHTDIIALRRDLQKLALDIAELPRACDPRLRSYVIKDNPDRPRVPAGSPTFEQRTTQRKSAVEKASPDDPKHPGWPAGTSDGRGGKFRPKDGAAAAATVTPVQYADNPYFPPPPPGHDPNTWKQRRWPNNNRLYLEDPEGNTFTAHPEDRDHWRHWDMQDGDGNDQGRWPPNSKKPWAGQKKLDDDQSTSDPNGDAPPWTPTPTPFLPIPVDPIPFPEVPIFPRVFIPG
jgi:hypothetical protein